MVLCYYGKASSLSSVARLVTLSPKKRRHVKYIVSYKVNIPDFYMLLLCQCLSLSHDVLRRVLLRITWRHLLRASCSSWNMFINIYKCDIFFFIIHSLILTSTVTWWWMMTKSSKASRSKKLSRPRVFKLELPAIDLNIVRFRSIDSVGLGIYVI